MMQTEMCYYVPGSHTIVDTATTEGRSTCYGETLDQIRLRYPGAELMPFSEALPRVRTAMAERYHVGIPEPTTSDRWDYALNVLPPCRWTHRRVGEAFFVSELVYANIADWYLRIGDRYWHMYHYTSANIDEMLTTCLHATQ